MMTPLLYPVCPLCRKAVCTSGVCTVCIRDAQQRSDTRNRLSLVTLLKAAINTLR
jgi:hypothetical protein